MDRTGPGGAGMKGKTAVWTALLAVSLAAGACAGEAETDRPGGEIVLAVEQWPECLNPVTSCANASWLNWAVLVHLQPSLMEFDADNTLRASPVLLEAPTMDNGGAAVNEDGTFTVVYRLNPEARWSDGTAITSADVRFTWRAHLDTEGSLRTVGYDLITEVDDSRPQTAVVTFAKLYAPWRYMFQGLLPAHAFDGDTDISGYWNDAIPVSGGPWLQESWSEGPPGADAQRGLLGSRAHPLGGPGGDGSPRGHRLGGGGPAGRRGDGRPAAALPRRRGTPGR